MARLQVRRLAGLALMCIRIRPVMAWPHWDIPPIEIGWCSVSTGMACREHVGAGLPSHYLEVTR